MKKLRNLFLIAVVCLVSILFTDKVFAAVEIEYPVYSGKLIYNKADSYVCSSVYDGCKEYNVSEDDGISDSEIKLTNINDASDTFQVNKASISTAYVVNATKNVDLKFQDVPTGGIEASKITGVAKVVYLKSYDEVIDAIKNAKEYDNIYSDCISLYNENITIPKNVTITTEILVDVDTIVNNGIIKTASLFDSINKISGSGIINLSYAGIDESVTDELPREWNESYRMNVNNISGVKVNVIDTIIKEGLGFGYIGIVGETTKEEAQKKIDMYNKVLGDTLNGYEVKLMTGKVTLDDENAPDEYYYGSLVKKKTNEVNNQNTTTVKKDEVKNPKTGDTVLYIVGAIVLSLTAFVVSYKKIRQN